MNKINNVLISILTLLFLAACKPIKENSTEIDTLQKTNTKENQLSMGSDSETIRLKMLYSHIYWKTIKVEGLANWYVKNETPQINHQQLWIVLPKKGRILNGFLNSNPDYIWISDGENIFDNGQFWVLPPYVKEPFTPPSIISDHIYSFPLSMVMVSPFADYIFPSGLAQRGGKYVPIKEDMIANRKALVVDWEGGTSNERFWIDIITGVILRDQIFYDKEKTILNSDIVMTFVQFDASISEEYFILEMPDDMKFEEMNK
jgi:hypothetical protein